MHLINSQFRLILLTAFFFVLSANWRFFSEAANAFPPARNLGFLISLAIVLACVLILLLTLFSNRLIFRPILSLLFLVAAAAAYFSDHFGTIIDDSMIANTLQTDSAEASDLLSIELVLRFLLLGLLPAILIWFLPIRYQRGWAALKNKLLLAAGALLIAIALIFSFSSSYASFFREHKVVRYYTNPTNPIYAAIRYVSRKKSSLSSGPLVSLLDDARIPEDDPHRELMIFVLGETARADHFSLYGYSKPTNPVMENTPELYVFKDVSSCGTSTAVSVPCIFSRHPRDDFDVNEAGSEQNLLDVLQRVGVNILWRDNNSDSKGVALRVPFEDYRNPQNNPVCDIECRDVGMLSGLQDHINSQPGDIMIVLHQMGNHGPAYYKRYPAEFEHFQPSCQTSELSECSSEEISNAYDNAIRYTDWFLGRVIELLKANQQNFETMMIYVSDHGESLGEYGLYLHGMPYLLAPDAQKQVPMFIWSGEHNDVDEQSLASRTQQQTSHDAIFSTVLNFFEVESGSMDSKGTLFETDRND